MIALKITEIGTFINKLLKDGMCDHFLLQEAVITQAATYTIDGSFHPDYYEPEELDTLHLQDLSYLPFSLLRPSCLKIMQGKKRPLFFKFVFLLSPARSGISASEWHRCRSGQLTASASSRKNKIAVPAKMHRSATL